MVVAVRTWIPVYPILVTISSGAVALVLGLVLLQVHCSTISPHTSQHALWCVQNPSLALASGDIQNLAVDLIGLATFAALYVYDNQAAQQRLERRTQVG